MELVPLDPIAQRILLIRGHRVMLDSDLAELYEVPTKRLNEQVRRNIKRFPPDFMFQLTPEEFAAGANKRFTAMDANKDNQVAKEEFDVTGVNKSRGSRASETNLPVAN